MQKMIKGQERIDNLNEAKKTLDKKLKVVSDGLPVFERNSKLESFINGFFVSNMISFMIGSLAFISNDGRDPEDYPFGHEPGFTINEIYGDMTYGQAIKNAYLLEDWRNGKGGVFQGICGLLSVLISIFVGVKWIELEKRQDDEEVAAMVKERLKELEQLKDYGVDMPKLVQRLTPSIKKILESLSELDRGYFDNLVAGGLDKANYETCVAIVSGYLKSHPKEYNKVVEIIDEATLPEEIKKKYGKGKTISFAAAQELQTER